MYNKAILQITLLLLLYTNSSVSQVNYVNNPSFETLYDCNTPYYASKCVFWNPLDSTKTWAAAEYFGNCYGAIPYNGFGFQYTKTGYNIIRTQQYCTTTCSFYTSRSYIKNRLKNFLISGKTYCVKMYVNLEDISPYAIDALQMYLGDTSLDTIKYCTMPLTYLSPQVSNPNNNIIGDTLGWVEVSGTFTATGTEKYLVIGNFKTDAATTKTNTGVGSGIWSDYLIDDVSVIDFNLAAYAGPDKNITLGDSAFIGQPPEIGLECTWATGTTTIGTGGGLWVKPTTTGTFSYVVTQNICGNIKKDTVNVTVVPSGISENTLFAQSIGIYPQPAKDILHINLSNYYEPTVEVKINDVDGRERSKHTLIVNSGKAHLEISELSNGVYILQITNSKEQTVCKRLIIAK